ncbi:hypothetical protein LCGC14_0933590 [marine sediment metagenome]|uniref:Uncharacterized protein n=1 Tax=marine sediment metagenome TaxID=412755 RepID=A0A0F9R5Q1_9ZZZZ
MQARSVSRKRAAQVAQRRSKRMPGHAQVQGQGWAVPDQRFLKGPRFVMLHDRDRRVFGDPICQLVLVVPIHAHAVPLVAPERQFKLMFEKGGER